MSETNGHTLGDVASFIRGITFTPDDVTLPFEKGTAVCMRTKNVQADLDEDDLIAVPKSFVRRTEQYLTEGDMLVSSANSWNLVGKCSWVPKLDYEVTAGGFISILRADRKQVDPRYLYHWFAAPRTQHEVRLCGRQTTNISNLNYERCLNLPIPLPKLEEQKRIAGILDKADDIRRKRQDAIDELKQLRLAVFYQYFRDDIIPDNMNKVLSDVSEVVSGVAKGRKLKGDDIRDVPYLRVANVQSGYLDMSEIKTIPAKESEVKSYSLRVGDVVMTEGGDHDKLGRGALWSFDIPDCIHQNHVFRVRLDRKHFLPHFFVYYLQSGFAKQYFLRCAKKTTNLASINMTQLRALPVPKVSLEKQERFEASILSIESCIERYAGFVYVSDHLFNSLVQRAFKGEL